MKSIIEEASSISKAIENAWKRAHQPSDFTVRIFEIPQKNMFGFTTKSAKIGLFFEEQKKSDELKKKDKPKQNVHHKEKVVQQQQPQPKPQPAPKIVHKPAAAESDFEPWNKEMVTFAQHWFNTLFKQLAVNVPAFSID